MTKNAVLWVLLLAIMTMFLSSCGGNSASGERNSETAGAVSESEKISAATTTATSETVTFCGEDIFSGTGETEAEPEFSQPEEPSFPVVISADEIYEFYPMKIISPEKQETAVKTTAEKMQQDIFIPEGFKAAAFLAEYPVISGIDGTVCKKINDEIKAYIDSEFEAFSEGKDDSEFYEKYQIELMEEYGQPMYEKIVNMTGTEFEVDGCDINGNILTVYFAVNYYMYGSNHGSEEPLSMLFDLRTGERIYFSGLVGDSGGLSGALKNAFTDFQFRFGMVPFGQLDADKYSEIPEPEQSRDITIFTAGDNIEFGTDEDGIYRVALRNADERMTVCNGCVGFYLAPYEYGSYANGIRRVDIPASEVIPFLNDKGKSLFEGYVSAESVPANVIEYKGKKYFDTTMWIPDIFDRDDPTDGDIEFISLFENARYREYYFEKYGIEKD